ncbi:DNA polymerase III subunit alpha [Candidatus Profftia sp. (ex Adelges kitamiensis)]|uniref:DNA polymerase III subunit alpha n=1 Tax=Candidatus Profftia sp. (ex Adelges kitamiensis) TaxID=2864218 RepID=UPI001CE35C87|nr:DNA polymerase III subunit alpha [Candidatus Profftia sp. (ex Adelges kitamiensis)]
MTEPRFIHLHVHSDYSIIDGLAKISTLVKKAAILGMPAFAITDHTNICGLIKFYNLAHEAGIKPIIGADLWVKSNFLDNEVSLITILAANNTGYKNLIMLISHAYQRGYGVKGPLIDYEWLINYREGLILLSGGLKGDIGKMLLRGKKNFLYKYIDFYKKYFANSYYIELIRTGRTHEESYLKFAVELAEECDLPVVATNDVCFLEPADFDAHEIRVAIHAGFTLDDPKRPKHYSTQQYMCSIEKMCSLFIDLPEALENSVEIAKRCNVTIGLGEYFLPLFPTGTISKEDYLIAKSKEGLKNRLEFLFPDEEIREKERLRYDLRLDIELKVINQMGFPSYFLIVMEFIQWSKDHGVPVGPGRGSGAGSLVAYALKITELDPLAFNLLFERFLNPERVSLPDFDVDFCMEKRDLVIDHVAEIYGRDAVSQIITFGTMTAKAVIRDVGRVLGYSYGFVDRISKLIPLDPGMTLSKAFKLELQFKKIYEENKEVRILIDMARKLEGITRNAGKHAGGVVIAPTKITDFAPLYCDSEGNYPVTQFDKSDIECTGLVKFDFLGLKTLTIIDWALKMINAKLVKKGNSAIDINKIPLNDQKSFKILQQSETTAIFQLESRGMKDLIKRLKPDCFEDIIALVALFRPGPLQSGMVDNFINRKHGLEDVYYPDVQWQHSLLKPILEPTYGIILYQEQVIQIAQILSGYTLGGADILRRAMGKKNPIEMAKQRSVFKEGAEKMGIDSELSMKIFDLVEKFAGYGFNKSHSAAYALISYQTLWLKAHYPSEFMAAVMTADMDNTEKIVNLVNECFLMGLKVLPPDINNGQYYFYVNEGGEIMYGIGAIKGVGASSIEAIIDSRNKGGYFKEIFDLCARTSTKKLNRRTLEKLILSGAFDCLGSHRASLMNSLGNALKAANQHHKAKSSGQVDMFNVFTTVPQQANKIYSTVSPWPTRMLLDAERDTLGFYLTGHPMNQYLKEIEKYASGKQLKDIYPTHRGKITTAVGLVIDIKIITTKKGNHIGLCTIDDRSGRLEVILFTDVLYKYQYLLHKDRILIISGQVNLDYFSSKIKMIACNIMDISEAREKYVRRIAISLTDKQNNDQFLNILHNLLKTYPYGIIPVYLYYQHNNMRTKLNCDAFWKVKITEELLTELRNLVGDTQIALEFD